MDVHEIYKHRHIYINFQKQYIIKNFRRFLLNLTMCVILYYHILQKAINQLY